MFRLIFLILFCGYTYTSKAQLLSYSFVKNSIKWSDNKISLFLQNKGFQADGKQMYKKVAASGQVSISLYIINDSDKKDRSNIAVYFHKGAFNNYFYLEKKIKEYCKKTEYFFDDHTQAFATEYLHPDGTYFTLLEQNLVVNKQKTTNYILYISLDKVSFDFRREL